MALTAQTSDCGISKCCKLKAQGSKLKGQSSTRGKQMFCPQCRTECREGFDTCTDCGVSLVSDLPPEPAPEYLEFEEILISLNPSDVAIIKSLLDTEGITYYFRGESSYSFAPPARLMVQKDRADEAREILKGLETSEDFTPEDSESDDVE